MRTQDKSNIWHAMILLGLLRYRRDHQTLTNDQSLNTRSHSMFVKLLISLLLRRSYDPRDKIYGILSLADTAIQQEVQPDYNVSAEDVYRKVAASSIKATKSLNILSCIKNKTKSGLGLLSYIPNWTASLEKHNLTDVIIRRELIDTLGWNTCNGSAPELEISATSSTRTRAVVLDRILDVQGPAYQKGGSGYSAYGNKFLDEFYRIANSTR